MDDYYERKFLTSGDSTRSCCYSLIMIALTLIIAVMCSGCRTIKESTTETTDTRDSVRVEYVEKIVKVPVMVTVEIPSEQKERQTRDTTSTLETSVAASTAALTWVDGEPVLCHSIWNKPVTITKPDTVQVTNTQTVTEHTSGKDHTKIIYKEKDLSAWQRLKISLAGWSLGLNIILIVLGFLVIRRGGNNFFHKAKS